MTPPVFRCSTATLADAVPGATLISLEGAEGRHAASVRRLREGERVDLVDGAGLRASATVAAVGRDRLDLHLVSRTAEPPPQPRIVVVQALVKGDRTELAVELLTEAGADEVVPWAAERCVVRWDATKADRALRRLRVVADEAAKQARRAHWPVVAPLAGTADVQRRVERADAAYLLHESAAQGFAPSDAPSSGEVVLVVGPEGGISETELAALGRAGASPVRLGPEVLRASTAGVVAVAALASGIGRWERGTRPGASD